MTNPIIKRLAPLLLSVGLLLALVLVFQLVAVRGRRLPDAPKRYEVTSAQEASRVLLHSGTRGRIVVVVGTVVPAPEWGSYEQFRALLNHTDLVVDATDLIPAIVNAGVAREVYVVVPDGEFKRVAEAVVSELPDALDEGDRVSHRVFGTRVTYLRSAALPSFSERIVTYTTKEAPGSFPVEFLASLESANVADIRVAVVADR